MSRRAAGASPGRNERIVQFGSVRVRIAIGYPLHGQVVEVDTRSRSSGARDLLLAWRKLAAPQADLDADLFYRMGNRRARFGNGDCHPVHDDEAPQQTYGDRLTKGLQRLKLA